MRTLDELKERFRADRFATGMGVVIDRVDEDGVVCSVELGEEHQNAAGLVQGGVVFTLADFAFAVAANREAMTTVTLDSTIHYLRAPKGTRLTATARCEHGSRSVCLYRVAVTDELGTPVASVATTGFIRREQ